MYATVISEMHPLHDEGTILVREFFNRRAGARRTRADLRDPRHAGVSQWAGCSAAWTSRGQISKSLAAAQVYRRGGLAAGRTSASRGGAQTWQWSLVHLSLI